MSSAIKSLLLMLGAVPLVIFLGNEIANEEYLFPGLICLAVIGCLIFSIAFRSLRPECVILGFLLAGYIVGNRGFAQLAIVQPLYVGEVGLATIVLALTGRYVMARERLDVGGALGRFLLLFIGFASVRFLFDVRVYGVDAARDFALAYYGVFFFLALRIGQDENARRFLQKTLVIAFGSQAVLTLCTSFAPGFLETITVGGVPLFVHKGDLLATFAVAGVFYIYFQPNVFGSVWLRRILLLLMVAAVAPTFARAAVVSLMAASLLPWRARCHGFFAYPGILAVGALCLFLLAMAVPELADDDRFAEIEDKAASIVDFSNTHHYRTDIGTIKGANNDFRRVLWTSIFEEANAENPLIGKGFGYDFIKRFEQIYDRGAWEGLRSAHNYFVTVYGRMGILGCLLLSGIAYQVVRGGWTAAGRVRRGELGTQALAYWCCAWTIFVAGLFGVVMEGPMGAIPFWSFLGLAVGTSALPKPEPESELEMEELLPVRENAREPAVAAR